MKDTIRENALMIATHMRETAEEQLGGRIWAARLR